jgi:hypothetical protein
MCRIRPDCARATSGHATVALPTSMMKSRRFTGQLASIFRKNSTQGTADCGMSVADRSQLAAKYPPRDRAKCGTLPATGYLSRPTSCSALSTNSVPISPAHLSWMGRGRRRKCIELDGRGTNHLHPIHVLQQLIERGGPHRRITRCAPWETSSAMALCRGGPSWHAAATVLISQRYLPQSWAPYSMSSSARMSSDKGTSIPIALVALRFTRSSTLLGSSTGRSAGLVPLSTRST